MYNFNEDTNTITITVNYGTGVSNVTFAINSEINTFDIFKFKDHYATSHESDELDFSINNNIIKTVNTADTTVHIYDTEPNLVFRKYEAGYTISTGLIDIQLRDERDRIVDLYGADWVMTAYATIHN